MSAKKKTPTGRASGQGVKEKIRPQNASKRTFRQQIKQVIIYSCIWGLIPIVVAEWLICRGGLADD